MKDSSISNSDFENEYQTLDRSGRIRVALKTLFCGLCIFGSICAIFYLVAGAQEFNGRVIKEREALVQITDNGADTATVMVLGSSMVEAGFEPALSHRRIWINFILSLNLYSYDPL